MRALAPGAARALPAARLDKIEYRGGDFNQPLPYEDASLDVVLFDAALHHAASPWFTLAECRRVVKPDGLLIAQREQYLAYLTEGIAIARLLRSVEVTSGVIENSFYRSQYEYLLRARGFEPVVHGGPDAPWQRALFFLNGLIFSKWVIVARPIPSFAFTPASS
jgi:ubiquinone/menaquinone biosynthesis C-methylase UbiE